jgi:hypothetical protein
MSDDVADLPDQKQLWDAYGHAMGAIGGVELLMRIALINKAVERMVAEDDFTEERKAAELKTIQGRTLGATVSVFKAEFPDFENDDRFCESIDNAVYCRNQLAHHFIENNLFAFRSEEGIELTTFGCEEHTRHFKSLEAYIRQKCPVDYDAFFRIGDAKEDEFVQGHPLREKLQAIQEGAVQPDQAGPVAE